MKQFLLDTDVLVDFFKKRPYAEHLLAILMNEGVIFLSILSVAELRTGWTDEEASYFLPRLRAMAQRVPITEEIAETAGMLRRVYRFQGVTLPTIDTLIAATAIINGHTLVTRNTKDYPMPELQLYAFPKNN